MAYVKNSLNQDFANLVALVCEGSELFRHYDSQKIAISCSRNKKPGKTGVWAFVAPLRFENGEKLKNGKYQRRSGTWFLDSKVLDERFPEARYIMNFIVPRFFILSAEERLETIVHEIYHLHPDLSGELRIFQGPFKHHGPTPHLYKNRVREISGIVKKNFSEILEHPILNKNPDFFASQSFETFSLPQRKFEYSKSRNFLESLFFAFIFLFLFVPSAFSVQNPERYFASKAGNLFDRAARFAKKTGPVIVEDELEKIKRSETGAWTFVRLMATGEEGWYPTTWIRTEKVMVPNVNTAWSVELSPGFATNGGTFNMALGFYRNLLYRTYDIKDEFSNWNRFEIGPEFMWFMGEKAVVKNGTSDPLTISGRWVNGGLAAHYYFQNLESRTSIDLFGSLLYFRRSITAPNISDDVLISLDQNPLVQGIGFSAGVGFHFELSRWIDCGVRFRYVLQKNSMWDGQGVIGVQF